MAESSDEEGSEDEGIDVTMPLPSEPEVPYEYVGQHQEEDWDRDLAEEENIRHAEELPMHPPPLQGPEVPIGWRPCMYGPPEPCALLCQSCKEIQLFDSRTEQVECDAFWDYPYCIPCRFAGLAPAPYADF